MHPQLIPYRRKITYELTGNLLPFWSVYGQDPVNGGHYGAISAKNIPDAQANKLIVQHCRLLWNYAHAYRKYGSAVYRELADRTYQYINRHFWDQENGGTYWMLDANNRPVNTNKKTYGLAFTIYAFSEYFRSTGIKEALDQAILVFEKLQEHAFDTQENGYFEACARDWSLTHDPLTGKNGIQEVKSMNTTIHLLEAYSNLLRVWDDDRLKEKQRNLVRLLLNKIIDPETYRQHLFFDAKWNPMNTAVSYGHDIETSWLLTEAAGLVQDPVLLAETNSVALRMADAVLTQGIDSDGGVFFEGKGAAIVDRRKMWWPQAEAAVGFLNAYQLSGRERYLGAFCKSWDFIENYLVDRRYGEWFHSLSADRVPIKNAPKADGWKTPYHNTRACFECLERISILAEERDAL